MPSSRRSSYLWPRSAEVDFLFVSDAGCCFVEAVPPSRFGAAAECGEIEAMSFSAAVPAPLQILMLDGEIDEASADSSSSDAALDPLMSSSITPDLMPSLFSERRIAVGIAPALFLRTSFLLINIILLDL